MFLKYQHLERWGTPETSEMPNGVDQLYIFPKLDGTNASIWFSNGEIHAGSRRRKLSHGSDNAGFFNKILALPAYQEIVEFLKDYPQLVFYGEFLTPHTLKTYLDSAWRNFYVFDVFDRQTESYLTYDEYRPIVEALSNIDQFFQIIPPLAVARSLNQEDIEKVLNNNFFLMKEGELGEGIVIKRYGFVNRYGRTTWGKVVRSEFKAQHVATMGPVVINSKDCVEEKIIENFLSEALIQKCLAKILNTHELEALPSKMIKELLDFVWHEFLTEEIPHAIISYKYPTLNFKQLNRLCNLKVKYVIGI